MLKKTAELAFWGIPYRCILVELFFIFVIVELFTHQLGTHSACRVPLGCLDIQYSYLIYKWHITSNHYDLLFDKASLIINSIFVLSAMANDSDKVFCPV